MVLLPLPIFVLVLLVVSAQSEIKIVSIPDGEMGAAPCATTCAGVDKDYSGWMESNFNTGKVLKWIDMSGCDFVSSPVVTVSSECGISAHHIWCPSFTVAFVFNERFLLYSLSDSTKDEMSRYQCRVYWTATGFTC